MARKSKYTEGFYVLTRHLEPGGGTARWPIGWLSKSTATILFREPPKGRKALYERLGFNGWYRDELRLGIGKLVEKPVKLHIEPLREPLDGAR